MQSIIIMNFYEILCNIQKCGNINAYFISTYQAHHFDEIVFHKTHRKNFYFSNYILRNIFGQIYESDGISWCKNGIIPTLKPGRFNHITK